MTWRAQLNPDERTFIDRYETLRKELQSMSGERHRIVQRATMRKKYKEGKKEACKVSQDS